MPLIHLCMNLDVWTVIGVCVFHPAKSHHGAVFEGSDSQVVSIAASHTMTGPARLMSIVTSRSRHNPLKRQELADERWVSSEITSHADRYYRYVGRTKKFDAQVLKVMSA